MSIKKPSAVESPYVTIDTTPTRLAARPVAGGGVSTVAAVPTEIVSNVSSANLEAYNANVSYYANGVEGINSLVTYGRIFAGANVNITLEEQKYITYNQNFTGNGTVGGTNGQIQFNNNGLFAGSAALTFDGANIVVAGIKSDNYYYANGQPFSGGANLGNWAFDANTQYNFNGGAINNSDLDHNPTSGLNIVYNGDTGNSTILYSTYSNIQLAASGTGVNLKTWTFGTDGTLTLPYGTTIKENSDHALAIGWNAGLGGSAAVSLGYSAGGLGQGYDSVAIGGSAGANAQGATAIAIGGSAGSQTQGVGAVAIGSGAGFNFQGEYAIAIGAAAGDSNQANNSIILNASGAGALDSTNAGLYIDPVRNDTGNTTNAVYYNTSTKELTYGPGGGTANTGDIRFNNTIIYSVANADIYIDPSNDEGDTGFIWVPGPSTADTTPVTVENQLMGNVEITSNSNTWTFGNEGQTVPPVLSVTRGDTSGGTISGYTLNIGDGTNEAIITTPDATSYNAQRLVINPGKGQDGTGGEGGDIYLWAGRGGDTNGNGGDVKVRGGFGPGNGQGGYIRLEAGDVGNVGTPGYVYLRGGDANFGSGGYVTLQGGYGGDGTGGAINIQGGDSGNGDLYDGNVNIQTGGHTWTFDNTGVVSAGGNLRLAPDFSNAGSYLDIFLTSGPDLHLVASAAANLILGKDDGPNVMTSWDGNVYVQSWNTGSNTQGGVWNFGEDGNLTAPGAINVGNLSIGQLPGYITANANTGIILNVSGPDGGFVVDYLKEDGNANTSGGELAFSSETGNATYRISLSDDLGDGFATKIWRFDGTGNLTLPDNTFSVNFANGTPVTFSANTGNVTFSDQIVIGTGISNVVGGLYLSPSPSSANNLQYLRVRGDVSYEPTHIHFDTGNNLYFNQFIGDDNKYVLLSNVGNIVIRTDDYAGNSAQWMFGTDGTLLLPRDVAGNTDPYLWITGGPTPSISSVDASLAGPANFQIVSDYLNLSGYTGAKVAIKADNGEIATDANMVLTTNGANVGNTYSWTFDTDGNLTLPSTTTIVADNGINLQANSGGNTSGIQVYGDADANVYAHTNVVIHTDSNGTGNTWVFDNTGNLTTPGSGGDIAGANVITSVTLSATSNVQAANVNATTLSALGNVVANNAVITNNISGASANIVNDINSGNLLTPGFVCAVGNVITREAVYSGNGATWQNQIQLANALIVAADVGEAYTQIAIVNTNGNGSADFAAYANNGNSNQGWVDMGFTGNTFNDPAYTVTGPNDGYVFAEGNASFGGNLVLATGNIGTTKDIVFATGGFQTGNIKARLFNSTGAFSVTGNVSGGNVLTTGIVRTGVFVTGNIPNAANVGAGARALVTDADTKTFANLYVGSSGNTVPVWSDGTNWYIG